MAKKLPKVRYEGTTWFFDERLRELRNVLDPGDVYKLNDFEIKYFKDKLRKRKRR